MTGFQFFHCLGELHCFYHQVDIIIQELETDLGCVPINKICKCLEFVTSIIVTELQN